MTSRLRIVYVHPSLGVGGAEELRLITLKHLDRARYDVRVCSLGDRGPIGAEIAALGVPVDALGRSDRTFDVGTTLALRRYLRAHAPDVVQTSLFRTNWHGRLAALLAGVPIVIAEEHSLHDPAVGFYRYSARLGSLFRAGDRWLAGRTAAIVACSNAVANSIAADEGIPRDRFVVIPNAADPERLQPVLGRTATRGRLGYQPGDIVVGAVSSLTPVKGHGVLLDAFADARRAMPWLKLLIVGDGPARPSIEAAIRRLGLGGDVRLVGGARALGDLIASMDIFASAALSEGFGINFVEAMALGVPCVAFRLGGIPEVVADGETGLLVPPRNTRAFAEALDRLASDGPLRAKLGAAGRARAATQFTPERYAQAMTALYERLRPAAVAA
jgi:glycosyltransferase involved in cell wall biosynthesis